MKCPAKIHAYGRDYQIELASTNPELEPRYAGRINHRALLITLNQNYPDASIRETALHELLHIIEVNSGLNLKESQIEAFSNGLFAALSDNPELVQWMFERKERK